MRRAAPGSTIDENDPRLVLAWARVSTTGRVDRCWVGALTSRKNCFERALASVRSLEKTGAPAGLLRRSLLASLTSDERSAITPLYPSLLRCVTPRPVEWRVPRSLRRARRAWVPRPWRGEDADEGGDPGVLRGDAIRSLRPRVYDRGSAGPSVLIGRAAISCPASVWRTIRACREEARRATRAHTQRHVACRPSTRGRHESGMGSAAAAGARILQPSPDPPPQRTHVASVTLV